ncbi:MFS transporter [Pseudonocardia spinosispora]|uniref:MFS transporter n=1 Tax=Pseudonocardia spinosispora TaxID=103441 RepID=UPI00041EEBB4|nr:MFS transporter [Pseudonocardia spinosispora]
MTEGDRTFAAGGSTLAQARVVLSTRSFRRLWIVTGLCSSADWLTVLALSGLAGSTATTAAGANFALPGVVLANLLPGLLFAPLGGLLADRFDRRVVMAVADIARCLLLLSIAFAGSYWWIFAGTFLTQVAAILWIPCKDSALPNLLRGPQEMESATQVGLVMTYGLSVLVGGLLFVLITGANPVVQLPTHLLEANMLVRVAIVVAAAFYLASAVVIATRLPELSRRAETTGAPVVDSPRLRDMVRDGVRYVRHTPLVRGLFTGMTGALAAGGLVVGAAQPYSRGLHGGQAAYGMLLLAIFLGVLGGLVGAPKLARRVPHRRLFGSAVVLAGVCLVPMALSPSLILSLVVAVLIGATGGSAFLVAITIIGSRVEDAMRGRVNAVYQSMLKIVLGCSATLSPLLITVMTVHPVTVWGFTFSFGGPRSVILGGSVVAVVAGVLAYRQMETGVDERRFRLGRRNFR